MKRFLLGLSLVFVFTAACVSSTKLPSTTVDRPKLSSNEVVDLTKAYLTSLVQSGDSTAMLRLTDVQKADGYAVYGQSGTWTVSLRTEAEVHTASVTISDRYGPPKITKRNQNYSTFIFRESTGTVVASDDSAAILITQLKRQK